MAGLDRPLPPLLVFSLVFFQVNLRPGRGHADPTGFCVGPARRPQICRLRFDYHAVVGEGLILARPCVGCCVEFMCGDGEEDDTKDAVLLLAEKAIRRRKD